MVIGTIRINSVGSAIQTLSMDGKESALIESIVGLRNLVKIRKAE